MSYAVTFSDAWVTWTRADGRVATYNRKSGDFRSFNGNNQGHRCMSNWDDMIHAVANVPSAESFKNAIDVILEYHPNGGIYPSCVNILEECLTIWKNQQTLAFNLAQAEKYARIILNRFHYIPACDAISIGCVFANVVIPNDAKKAMRILRPFYTK